MHFSPRLDSYICKRIAALDDERSPIAETWRRVGREADGAGLPRPGYHSVRAVVQAERQRRAELRAARRAAAAESLRYIPDAYRLAEHIEDMHAHRRRR